MKKFFKYIILSTIVFVYLIGCAEKKVDLASKDQLGIVEKPKIEKIDIVKIDKKYEMMIYVPNKDISVFYGKNPFSLTVIVQDVEASTDVMKYSYADEVIENISVLPRQNQVL
ncbi:MAG: hypothetical protein K6348_01755, partial [Deferribacterales bacterium]